MEKSIKEKTLNIQLESLEINTKGLAFDDLIRVFNKFKRAFNTFLEMEFFRDAEFSEIQRRNARAFESIKKSTELLILELNIEKFRAVIGPDIFQQESFLFEDVVLNWQRNTFEKFKSEILLADFNAPQFIKDVMDKYNLNERLKIFKPVFEAIAFDKSYKINLLDPDDKVKGSITPPHNIVKEQLLSEKIKDYTEFIIQDIKKTDNNGDK